jgi:hypothetical protein
MLWHASHFQAIRKTKKTDDHIKSKFKKNLYIAANKLLILRTNPSAHGALQSSPACLALEFGSADADSFGGWVQEGAPNAHGIHKGSPSVPGSWSWCYAFPSHQYIECPHWFAHVASELLTRFLDSDANGRRRKNSVKRRWRHRRPQQILVRGCGTWEWRCSQGLASTLHYCCINVQ